MKKRIMIFVLMAAMACGHALAQFTADVSVNTPVSLNSEEVTGIKAVSMPSGKTCIAYFDGYFKLKLQVLDEFGNKSFLPTGITLDSAVTSYSLANTVDMIVDEEENIIIAFANWEEDSVKLFVVSLYDGLLDQRNCGEGYHPILELLEGEGFILAYSTFDSTTVIRKNFCTGGMLSNSWSKSLYNSAQDLIALPSDRFYVVSYAPTPAPGYAYTYVNLVSASNGNAMWSNWAQCSPFANSAIYTAPLSAVADDSLNIYVTNTYFENMSQRRAFTQCIDVNGNLLWGANGALLCDTLTMYYQHRAKTLFNNATDELLCLVNGDDGIYYQKLNSSGAQILSTGGKALTPGIDLPELFGMGYCGTDLVFTYISTADNHIYASKINNNGSFAWSSSSIPLNTTANSKTWVDAIMCTVTNNQIVIIFEEQRHIYPAAFAQNIYCDGSMPTGLAPSNADQVNIMVYPNPNNGQFTVCTREPADPGMVIINDFTGRMVHCEPMTGGHQVVQAELPPGLYIVRLQNQQEIIDTQKMIIR